MRSFARAFGIPIVKDVTNLSFAKKEYAALGWGRYDETLIRRISNGTQVGTSFAHMYFDHLGRQRIRGLFRFPKPVLEAATSFVDSIRKHRKVLMLMIADPAYSWGGLRSPAMCGATFEKETKPARRPCSGLFDAIRPDG